MTQEQITTYTRRISASNRSELIVVLYDLFFTYLDEKNIPMAEEVLRHLMKDLNFQYEVSGNLYSLYEFCMRNLAKYSYLKQEQQLEEIRRVMGGLREAFLQVAAEDHSEPLMKNAQQVSAGYTYGKYDLNLSEENYDGNRGFLA